MILVTGATGLVGAHLVFRLISEGKTVRALKRKNSSEELIRWVFSYYSKEPELLLSKIKWVHGDLLDYYSLLDAMDGVEIVYHSAALVSFHASDKKDVIITNRDGTANIVNAALEKNIKKLCYVSTIGTLGRNLENRLTDENTFFESSSKSSVYSASKYEAEREVWRGIAEGLNAVIVNPSIIIGPGDWKKGSSRLFFTMWNGLKFYSGGSNGFIDVNDVVHAMILLTEGEFTNERFVLSAENITYKQLFEWMASAMNIEPPRFRAGKMISMMGVFLLQLKNVFSKDKQTITRETARTANKKYMYSNQKVVQATGIKFTSVQESVQRTAKIFLIEQQKNI